MGITLISGRAFALLLALLPLSTPVDFQWPTKKPRLALEKTLWMKRPVWSLTMTNEDILLTLDDAGHTLHNQLVNVGSADQCLRHTPPHECDETNLLLQVNQSWGLPKRSPRLRRMRGLLFEPRTAYIDLLETVYKGVVVINDGLHIKNASAQLKEHGIPKAFDVLKIDTDGDDCDMLEAVLRLGYRPRVLQAEYNPLYPPPIRYNLMHYDRREARSPNLWLVNECSLAYLSDMLRSYGYSLLQVDAWDAWYAQTPLLQPLIGRTEPYDDLTWYIQGVASDPLLDQVLKRTIFSEVLTGLPMKWIRQLNATGHLDRDLLLRQAWSFIMRNAMRKRSGTLLQFILHAGPPSQDVGLPSGTGTAAALS